MFVIAVSGSQLIELMVDTTIAGSLLKFSWAVWHVIGPGPIGAIAILPPQRSEYGVLRHSVFFDPA
jgi:hypothetical protein